MSDLELNRWVGRLEARATATEGRADRFENAVAAQLLSLDNKLDTQDTKIDAISAALAGIGGRGRGWGDVFRWVAMLVTTAVAAAEAFLHSH
jgi:hypothetical protein